MKLKAILLNVLMLLCGISAIAQEHNSIAIGSTYPIKNFSAEDVVSGQMIKFEAAATDKGLLVIFTCNTCPFVLKSMPRMVESVKMAQAEGLGLLIVNANEAQRDEQDAPEEMKQFAQKHNYPNYLIDKNSALADAFGANRTPEVFLFDGNQKLVYKGAMDDNVQDPANAEELFLQNAVKSMLQGKSITQQETKSIGCTIKRVKKP
jgi:thiol-disulfide isomerase/thioredoxin